jgi:predicted dehydrogenase
MTSRDDGARDAAGKQVAIGYQWSFSPRSSGSKADILAGVFGGPSGCAAWSSGRATRRTTRATAGRRDQGRLRPPRPRLPVNNACAHYLHNLFYLLGARSTAAISRPT